MLQRGLKGPLSGAADPAGRKEAALALKKQPRSVVEWSSAYST